MSDERRIDPTMGSAISPHFTRLHFGEHVSDLDKVAIFADRVRGWQLDIAERLIRSDPHAGFAALAICASYFEMISKHRDGYVGDGGSQEHFVKGARWVLGEPPEGSKLPAATREKAYTMLYTGVRNGLYHDAITGAPIGLSRAPGMENATVRIRYDDSGKIEEIIVNPEALVLRMQQHFSAYVAELQRDDEARARFARRFDSVAQG